MTTLEPIAGSELTAPESKILADLEARISSGFKGFVETGAAFKEIRDSGERPSDRLYRATHATFEDYCREVWGLDQSTVYRLIDASDIAGILETSPIGDVSLPSESVARQLAPLAGKPEKLIKAWAQATETHGPKPTAKQVREIVQPIVFRDSMRKQGYLDKPATPTEHVEARKTPTPTPVDPPAEVIEDAEIVDLAVELAAVTASVREALRAGATTQEVWDAYQEGLS